MSALDVEAVIADLKRRRSLLDDAITALTAYQEGHVRSAGPLGDSVRLTRPPFEVTSGQLTGVADLTYYQNPAPDAAAPATGAGVHTLTSIRR